MYIGLRIKYPLILSYCNENWIFVINVTQYTSAQSILFLSKATCFD